MDRVMVAPASMGPRSEDRGYRGSRCTKITDKGRLQWVHGPRTVVIVPEDLIAIRTKKKLQWVHDPRTVVIAANVALADLVPE